jgi:hypothetical protein
VFWGSVRKWTDPVPDKEKRNTIRKLPVEEEAKEISVSPKPVAENAKHP